MNTRNTANAPTAPPRICAITKPGADSGAIPANELERVRAIVTAGFAKEVEEVAKYAAVMYPATAKGAMTCRPDVATPKTIMRRPNVATISPSQMPPPERTCVERFTASSPNIRFAMIAPITPPTIWAITYPTASFVDLSPPNMRSAIVTTGLRCAPDTCPKARMIATSAPAVAIVFSSN